MVQKKRGAPGSSKRPEPPSDRASLVRIADQLEEIAVRLGKLGLNDAWTEKGPVTMGAIEMLSLEVKNAGEAIAGAIGTLGGSIDELVAELKAARPEGDT